MRDIPKLETTRRIAKQNERPNTKSPQTMEATTNNK